jgi:hypothetical protein
MSDIRLELLRLVLLRVSMPRAMKVINTKRARVMINVKPAGQRGLVRWERVIIEKKKVRGDQARGEAGFSMGESEVKSPHYPQHKARGQVG